MCVKASYDGLIKGCIPADEGLIGVVALMLTKPEEAPITTDCIVVAVTGTELWSDSRPGRTDGVNKCGQSAQSISQVGQVMSIT